MTRALSLLRALGRFPDGATTAELARAVNLAPATAGRLLTTLSDDAFIARTDVGWVVGPELVRVAARADPHRSLIKRTRPLLERLAATAGEAAMLAVPRPGPQIEILAQADGPRLLGLTNWVGRPIEMHASAAGKIALAELDDEKLVAWIRRERPRRLTPHTLTTRKELTAELARVRARGWATLSTSPRSGSGRSRSVSATPLGRWPRSSASVGRSNAWMSRRCLRCYRRPLVSRGPCSHVHRDAR